MKLHLAALLAAVAMTAHAAPDLEALQRQVADTERAFARSMADRNHAAFTALLSEMAVFNGGARVLRGKAEVAAAWKRFFEGPKAPFSWEPDQVDVLADGTLAHSTGPVRDEDGKLVSRFNSVWRQEQPGVWRIVFDKGQPLTEADRALAEKEAAPKK
jgi:ketosteroid isomerase-like protein